MSLQTILTIEDDAAIRRGVVDALTFAGYKVIESGDGDEGCQMALAREYDLLLLDLVLPGKQGLEILKQLRAVKPTLPVIVLTARGDEHDRVAGLRLGAVALLLRGVLALSERRAAFVSAVTHELRTPLTTRFACTQKCWPKTWCPMPSGDVNIWTPCSASRNG